MSSPSPTATLRHAAGLCWIAGFVDAIGYFHFGHVFTANMTGNTVLLGASIVRLEPIALTYAATLAAFILGVVCAVLTKRHVRGLATPMLVNAAILAVISLAPPANHIVLLSLAFAMGIQGATISAFSGIRLPTVVVTSTLVNLVEGLVNRASAALDATPATSNQQLQHLFVAWATYGIGGASAVLFDSFSAPLLAPICAYLLIAADLSRRANAVAGR